MSLLLLNVCLSFQHTGPYVHRRKKPKTKSVRLRGTLNTPSPRSVVNEGSTDRAIRGLWESSVSSLQRKHGRMSSWKAGVGTCWGGWYTGEEGSHKGHSWTVTRLGLKEKNLSDPKEAPPHWAVQCLSLHLRAVLTAEQLDGQLGFGPTCCWQSDGPWKSEPGSSSWREETTGGWIGGLVTSPIKPLGCQELHSATRLQPHQTPELA